MRTNSAIPLIRAGLLNPFLAYLGRVGAPIERNLEQQGLPVYALDNPIKRYSIGSSTPGLKTAADGSITIYFQATSPGKGKESNWLPAPEGPFWPILRTYGPGPPILDGSWKLPPVKQVQ